MEEGSPGESGKRLKATSLSSFNNLVSLANAQESWLKSSRELVWRDAGATPVFCWTVLDCLDHGLTGGLWSAFLAHCIRGGINVLSSLIIRRDLTLRRRLYAFFKRDAARFAAMIGTFSALYKFLVNLFPIYAHREQIERIQSSILKTRKITSRDAFDDDGLSFEVKRVHQSLNDNDAIPTPPVSVGVPHLSSITRRTEEDAEKRGFVHQPWHAAIAGSIAGGVAVMMEKPSHRASVGQQLLVRGLQGYYNQWSHYTGFEVPYGSVVVFTLCAGQIIYSFLFNPHTLSPTYVSWIQTMSNAPAESVAVQRSLMLYNCYDPALIETLLGGKSKPWLGVRSTITPAARVALERELQGARRGNFGPQVASCEVWHPHRDGCTSNVFLKIFDCVKLLLPVYGALHLIPSILLRRRAFLRSPGRSLLRVGFGAVRSSTFIGVFVAILQAGVCLLRNTYLARDSGRFSQLTRTLSGSRIFWWILSALTGLSLLVEAPQRRGELAMYVLPKAGESAWIAFRETALGIKHRRRGAWKADVTLSAVAMGAVMSLYQTDPSALSGFVRRLLYQFIGPN